jgi:hypothetical protein
LARKCIEEEPDDETPYDYGDNAVQRNVDGTHAVFPLKLEKTAD